MASKGKSGLVIKSVLCGAVGGALLLAFAGFKLYGWHTYGQALSFADKAARSAALRHEDDVLAVVCAAIFRTKATPAQWTELRIKDGWEHAGIVDSVVDIPGVSNLNYTAATNCADVLLAEMSARAQGGGVRR